MSKIVRKFVFVAVIVFVTLVGVSCKKDDKAVLNVYNWGDYIDPDTIDEFEKEFNIDVNYDTFSTNEDMYVKIKSGGGNYDVLFPSDYMIEKMIKEDMNNISNYKNIDDKFKNLDFDPKNEYSVPYMWGTLGIIYNKKFVNEKIDSWNALWDEKYKGQILMLFSQRDSLTAAFRRLGYSKNTKNPEELLKAKDELIKQKPLVYAYVGDEVKDLMIGEEANLAIVWSGDAAYMIKENNNLEYVVPKEGSNLWFDNVVIPKGSKHKKEAEEFINFLCRGDIAAKNAEYIGYSSPNKEGVKLLPKDIQNDKVAYPDEETINNCEIFTDLGDFVKEYDRIWTEIIGD